MFGPRAFPRHHLTLVLTCGVLASIAATMPDTHSERASAVGHAITPAVAARPPRLLAGIPGAATTFSCQTATAMPRCYAPQQIRQAYNIQPILNGGITGQGRTIVIIDAFQSPTITTDVQLFDQQFNLPAAQLHVIAPYGVPPYNPGDPNQVGWAAEITLDVEWSHAIAPGATIDLVLAPSNQDQDILNVTRYAITKNLGDVISQSFGEGETCAAPSLLAQEHQLFQQATAQGTTLFASAGDQGAAQPTCDGSSYFLSASTPASDPLVTAVGGTSLNANPVTGNYIGEVVWNDSYGAGGGGLSTIYPRPSFQNGLPLPGRGEPDVAYNGDVNGGVLGVWSSSGQGFGLVFIFGGTSAGSPQWAGITALADQDAGRRLGWLNPALYQIGQSASYPLTFHDIRYGNNTYVSSSGQVITGYNATRGWDLASGWGSPNVANLLPLLTLPASANGSSGG